MKDSGKVVDDQLLRYGLPSATAYIIWEITKDPKWVALAFGIQILTFRGILGIGSEVKKNKRKSSFFKTGR